MVKISDYMDTAAGDQRHREETGAELYEDGMDRYVRQKIETTMDGEMCAPGCYFYSENRRKPICWLGRGSERLRDGCRTALCR